MPCDIDGRCGYPGEPGTKGALHHSNHELVEAWKRSKALGEWVLPIIGQDLFYSDDSAHNEMNLRLLYELELENRALRQQYTEIDQKTGAVKTRRLIWDSD